jgi:ABC-type bacteriocin/lantibiotic exporter with double-glycine peptidase domain
VLLIAPREVELTLIKVAVDWLARTSQSFEEMVVPGTVVLNIERSVQLDRYSCGAQSAYMILKYFGKARSIQGVTRALGTDENGTGPEAISRVFRERGLRCRTVVNAKMADLRRSLDAEVPVLVSLHGASPESESHWAVAYGYSEDGVYVADPSPNGLRVRVRTAAFRKRWDRWAMFSSPSPTSPKRSR